MQIRETDPERDVDALVALMRESEPHVLTNIPAWLHRDRSVPARARLRAFVAEVDGAVVGESYALLRPWLEGDLGLIHVAVSGSARGQGIGSALYDAALVHADQIGLTELAAMFFETPEGMAFATMRGFRPARADQLSAVDPRTIAEVPAAEVQPASSVDPRVLHELAEAAMHDVPGLAPHRPSTFDEWSMQMLARPLYQPEGSFVAYADDGPAAMSLLTADFESGRAVNNFTGTSPQFRGRGLALAAKVATLRWSAANGITTVSTVNDEENAPMLAINRRLGYKPAGRRVEYVCELRQP
jgi:GNAT superfamily N-acetyltransferase